MGRFKRKAPLAAKQLIASGFLSDLILCLAALKGMVIKMICKKCGRAIGTADICPFCEEEKYPQENAGFSYPRDGDIDGNGFSFGIKPHGVCSDKSRLTAGILQLFCGAFGIGRFYMGYKTYAVLQIAATLATLGVGGVIWGAADGIAILSGTVMYDGDGRLLK